MKLTFLNKSTHIPAHLRFQFVFKIFLLFAFSQKPRGNIQLAEPEDIDICQDIVDQESDDSFESEESSSSDSIVETSDSELDQYVARNLGVSMKNQSNHIQLQPTGPAANLLSSMGLPIHQIFNSKQSTSRNHFD